MLALGRKIPIERRRNAFALERVGHLLAREQAAPVDPSAEIGRDGDVGRGGDHALGDGALAAAKPACVDITGWMVTGNSAGTSMRAASCRRAPAANGTRSRNRSSSAGAMVSPSNLSHSCPGRIFIAARRLSVCAGVISPA